MSPAEIINEITKANLRGRGGAGFPTGLKWQTLYNDKADRKFVVVNAAEGEPGTFKDRMVLRKNPYALIEGVLIAAHVLDTPDIYIGIKGSFILEIQRIFLALDEFKSKGLLEGINIILVGGPEDYLFGEEKALLNVIEGVGPLPREAHYPPYVKGLFATPSSHNPALVNNVETFARVPEILLKGASSFRAIGTESTPGPVICTVSGDVRREGIFEVPAGTTMHDLLYNHALGPRANFPFKLILNGVSSAVIKAKDLKVKLDHDEMAKIGSGLGSCSFIAYDESRSAVRVAQEAARFLYVESCNQCPSCKSGLGVSSNHIDKLFEGAGDKLILERVLYGAKTAPHENRCYLPVQGSIIIPSLVKAYPAEFDELLKGEKEVPAPVVLPKISDYSNRDGRFMLKEMVSSDAAELPFRHHENFLDRRQYSR